MAKKLSQMTTDDVRQEMSIAGSPDKITGIMQDFLAIIGDRLDRTNAAEYINLEFALKRVLAEVRVYKRQLEKRTGQKF